MHRAAACLALSGGQRLLARAYLEFNTVNAATFLADEIGYVPDERD